MNKILFKIILVHAFLAFQGYLKIFVKAPTPMTDTKCQNI